MYLRCCSDCGGEKTRDASGHEGAAAPLELGVAGGDYDPGTDPARNAPIRPGDGAPEGRGVCGCVEDGRHLLG